MLQFAQPEAGKVENPEIKHVFWPLKPVLAHLFMDHSGLGKSSNQEQASMDKSWLSFQAAPPRLEASSCVLVSHSPPCQLQHQFPVCHSAAKASLNSWAAPLVLAPKASFQEGVRRLTVPSSEAWVGVQCWVSFLDCHNLC